MKQALRILLLALLALLLCGCAAAPAAEGDTPSAAPSPETAAVPTPEPTPAPTPEPTEWTLHDESAEEILALADIAALRRVDGTASREYAAMLELSRLRPDCEVLWSYEFEGRVYPSTATELKAEGLEGLEDAVRYLPALTYIDVIDTPAAVEDLDRLYDINPDAFYYWSFPLTWDTITTDIQVYSSLQDGVRPRLTDEELYPLLKYCRHLKALDLGHNDLTDLSLVGGLTELEVLILADNPRLTDASPLANLTKLHYLEFFMNPLVEDYNFLNSLTNIEELNLCRNDGLSDLSFLEGLPKLRFLMIKFTGVSEEDVRAWQERLPDTRIVYYTNGDLEATGNGWRETQKNHMIRDCFFYWRLVEQYDRFDQVRYRDK
jgi:hypothetical protein